MNPIFCPILEEGILDGLTPGVTVSMVQREAGGCNFSNLEMVKWAGLVNFV